MSTGLLEWHSVDTVAGGRVMSADAHAELIRSLLAEPLAATRVRRATEELLRLEEERMDLTAIRDAGIYRLVNTDGHSYNNIAAVTGLTKARAAQLVRRANEVHSAAASHVSRLKRRAGR